MRLRLAPGVVAPKLAGPAKNRGIGSDQRRPLVNGSGYDDTVCRVCGKAPVQLLRQNGNFAGYRNLQNPGFYDFVSKFAGCQGNDSTVISM